MLSEIKVRTKLIPVRRRVLRGRLTVVTFGLGRHVVTPDGRVTLINYWVSRRTAIERLALSV